MSYINTIKNLVDNIFLFGWVENKKIKQWSKIIQLLRQKHFTDSALLQKKKKKFQIQKRNI